MGLILYKYFTIFLVWSYLLTMGAELIVHKFTFISDILTIKLLGIYLISAFILRLMRKVRFLQDEYTWNITVIGFALIDCICVVNNLYEQDYNSYVMCIVMIIWNLIDLGDIKTWFKEVVARFSLNVELYPLALAIYAIANTRIIMENQLSLGFHSIVVTLFYLVSALTLIILGFKYGYRWIRYGGLLLSLLSLAKLFMLDIATGVEGMYKILSYFCFGIVLLVISYIYQRFSKQIEMDMPQILTKKTEKETI